LKLIHDHITIDGKSLLEIASVKKLYYVVEQLFFAGAFVENDLFYKVCTSTSLEFRCDETIKIQILSFFISNGLFIGDDSKRISMFLHCLKKRHIETCQLLIDNCSINIQAYEIAYVLVYGELEFAEKLLMKFPEIKEERDKYGNNPMISHFYHSHMYNSKHFNYNYPDYEQKLCEGLKFMIRHGIDISPTYTFLKFPVQIIPRHFPYEEFGRQSEANRKIYDEMAEIINQHYTYKNRLSYISLYESRSENYDDDPIARYLLNYFLVKEICTFL
jgi:hypothetical protein